MEYADQDHVIEALEEFIFGLSWEQIEQVRSKMEAGGISSIDRAELSTMLDPSDFSGCDVLLTGESTPSTQPHSPRGNRFRSSTSFRSMWFRMKRSDSSRAG